MSYALITGASSGIGMEFARQLNKKGYDLILVARRLSRLEELKKELSGDIILLTYDLSIEDNCFKLIDDVKNYDISLFINNAGFGECGDFTNTDINKELNMINLNVKALYILTKKALEIMNSGRILNVGSIAGILPSGPYMAQYYATKSYVRSLSEGIAYELKKKKSKIRVSVLCPGPVNTEFNENANVKLGLKGMSAYKCVKYTLKHIKKTVIIPGSTIRLGAFFSRLVSRGFAASICAHQQKKKG